MITKQPLIPKNPVRNSTSLQRGFVVLLVAVATYTAVQSGLALL
jgi:hypothetical protein